MRSSISNKRYEDGYTLIELIAVVALLSVVSVFFISRFNFSSEWAVKDSVGKFVNTLNFLKIDSRARQVKYIVEINIDNNSYIVWEILPPQLKASQNVDLLSGFRTKEEQLRREEKEAKKALENLDSLTELSNRQDSIPLEMQFYAIAYSDTGLEGSKIPPLDSPSLSEIKLFSPEIKISSIKIGDNTLVNSRTNSNIRSIPLYPGLIGGSFEIILETDTNKFKISNSSGLEGVRYETF